MQGNKHIDKQTCSSSADGFSSLTSQKSTQT